MPFFSVCWVTRNAANLSNVQIKVSKQTCSQQYTMSSEKKSMTFNKDTNKDI